MQIDNSDLDVAEITVVFLKSMYKCQTHTIFFYNSAVS
jgi:hypothetical protein